MIRALIFDCFGVLYQEGFKYLMELCSEDGRRQLEELHQAFDYGYIAEEEYLVEAAQILGIERDEILQILNQRQIKNDRMVSEVRRLKTHYKTALLSNIGNRVLPKLFNETELRELFDTVVLSGDEGVTKPDEAIFRITAERLGVAAAECAMIDDSQINCAGAAATGMRDIRYENHQQCFRMLKEIGVM